MAAIWSALSPQAIKSKESFSNGKSKIAMVIRIYFLRWLAKFYIKWWNPSHNSLDELVNKFADYFTE